MGDLVSLYRKRGQVLGVPMRTGKRSLLAVALLAPAWGVVSAAIIKDVDRKFPQGFYCPVESRPIAGGDVGFVAPASTIRVTFSAPNETSGTWNHFRIDNVAVVLKTVFDANQVTDPDYANCYDTTPPPGQATGGMANAPAYNFNATSTPEVYLDLFPTAITGWTGASAYFDSTLTATNTPSDGNAGTGGSLGIGLASDGNVTVSASRLISGLTVGQTYALTFWWHEQTTTRLTITIGVPCADADSDRFVVCSGGCDLAVGQTCGDCNDSNAHCGAVCTDVDVDTWCASTDCNDSAATCTSDCTTDTDTDLVPDCRDGCLDADRDGYGTAGGLGNTCLGADCNPSNRFCNVSCTDGDGDGHCLPGDCQDGNAGVGNQLPEVNDFADQNCPADPDGFGVIDEVSGNSGFRTVGVKGNYSWDAQTGASMYLAARAGSPTFPAASCTQFPTSGTLWSNAVDPSPGQGFYYLVRADAPSRGSWGQKSGGVDRPVICGMEADCDNGLNDDGDAATDCADTDCAGTPACRAQTFAFTDTVGDDIANAALQTFFQGATAGASDYIFFQITGAGRTVAWCSVNAAFYRTQYLALAPTNGTVTSGSWQKWRKAPSTSNAWVGPDTAGHVNTFGNDCFGDYSWCSEQWSPEPQNAIFPDRINDCEVYDMASGACGSSTGLTYTLSIKIAATRLVACGF